MLQPQNYFWFKCVLSISHFYCTVACVISSFGTSLRTFFVISFSNILFGPLKMQLFFLSLFFPFFSHMEVSGPRVKPELHLLPPALWQHQTLIPLSHSGNSTCILSVDGTHMYGVRRIFTHLWKCAMLEAFGRNTVVVAVVARTVWETQSAADIFVLTVPHPSLCHPPSHLQG